MSPYMHNSAFAATGENAVFMPLQVGNLDEFLRRKEWEKALALAKLGQESPDATFGDRMLYLGLLLTTPVLLCIWAPVTGPQVFLGTSLLHFGIFIAFIAVSGFSGVLPLLGRRSCSLG